jgi:chromosome partitioning protein
MKVITVSNVAGGVGKTTSAHAIAVASVEYGKKVLLIDADPGAGLTFSCGIENPRLSSLEFLSGEFPLESALLKTTERFNLLPSSTRLSTINIDESITTERFREAARDFDVVIVDTATGPNRLATYFLALADLVLIPTTSEILSIRGALHTKDFATSSGYSHMPYLLITKETTPLGEEKVSTLKGSFELLEPSIRNDALVPNSQQQGSSALTLESKSGVAADYREITYSLLEALEIF